MQQSIMSIKVCLTIQLFYLQNKSRVKKTRFVYQDDHVIIIHVS